MLQHITRASGKGGDLLHSCQVIKNAKDAQQLYDTFEVDVSEELFKMAFEKGALLYALVTEGIFASHLLDETLTEQDRRRKLETQIKKLSNETKWMNRPVHMHIQPRLLREASDRVVNVISS